MCDVICLVLNIIFIIGFLFVIRLFFKAIKNIQYKYEENKEKDKENDYRNYVESTRS